MKLTWFGIVVLIILSSCISRKNREQQAKQERDADYYYDAGLDCNRKGDIEGALKYYNKAISLDSTIADYYLNRGVNRYELGMIDESFMDLHKAIQLDSTEVLAYYNLSYGLSELKRYEEAIVYYELAIKYNKDEQDSSALYFDYALCLYYMKDYEQALKSFLFLIDNINPKHAKAYYFIGKIQKHQNNPEEAKRYFSLAKKYGFEIPDEDRDVLE